MLSFIKVTMLFFVDPAGTLIVLDTENGEAVRFTPVVFEINPAKSISSSVSFFVCTH